MKDISIEVHGCHEYDQTGAISEPIYLSATFRHPALGESTGYDYGRVANPTRDRLETTLSALERGERCWALSSGMAAINLVFHLLPVGSRIILSEDLYGGTVRLGEIYEMYGIEAVYIDTADAEAVAAAMTPDTKMLFIETPSNPMMRVTDIRRMADIAHKNGALLVCDNTFLSPHIQKPLALGADIVLHSATKYLGGHNDIIAGALIVREKESEYAKRLELLIKSEGPNLTPLDSWLLLRSLKTLSLRVERQEENARKIAEWLKTQENITKVYYVGLPDHPGCELQKSQAAGFGAMISFKVKEHDLVAKILSRIKLIAYAESLGGVESLLTYPLCQTHADMPKELLAKTGLDDCLMRLSVGIEDIDDLIADLDQAING